MPGLIPLIKKVRPDLPIIYRSHIEIRSDLVHIKGSPQEEVWDYLWKNIQLADMFISASAVDIHLIFWRSSLIRVCFLLTGHPVAKFVPDDVPVDKLSLLGAATDWCVLPALSGRRVVNLTQSSMCQARRPEQAPGRVG